MNETTDYIIRVLLFVQKANYAANMYLKFDFRIIDETDEEFIMIKDVDI